MASKRRIGRSLGWFCAIVVGLAAPMFLGIVPQAEAQSTIWPSTATPAVVADSDTGEVELGVKFRSDLNGFITGIRFYKGATNTGTHVGRLWTSTGTQLASVTFTGETASGWQQANFASPVAITANTVYVASYHAPVGRYSVNNSFFASAGVDNPPLHALANGVSGGNGVYQYGAPAFPSSTYLSSNYWVDVVFTTSIAPTVTSVTPANGATDVSISTTVTATFSKAMDPASITTTTFVLQGLSGAVPAAVSYNAGTLTATLTPSAPLALGTTYTATVRGGTTGVKDSTGAAMAADFPWSFTTSSPTPPTVTSVTPANGATGVATNTAVTAVFSKAMDAATITSTTFALQGPAGAVTAAVSYNATTRTATLTPTAALANSTTYTATVKGGATGVKDPSGIPMTADFVWSFTTVIPTPPTVTSVTPVNGAVGVATNTTVTAVFSKAMDPATITTATFLLQRSGVGVTASVTYNATTRTATLTPSAALANSTTYTATVKGGATGGKDSSGLAMSADFVWTFQTAIAGSSCCSIWPSTATPAVASANDPNAIELGVRFRSDSSGSITALRFYKGASNTGTHVGKLWTSAGELLASVTFTSETASGWQQASLATPVPITSNTIYVASYHTNVGFYSVTSPYFSAGAADNPPLHGLAGVYAYGASAFPTSSYNSSNYWVDVVLAIAQDTTPPTVASVSPTSGAVGVQKRPTVTASFSESVNSSTVNSTTFELRDSLNNLVPATVTYNPAGAMASLIPAAALTPVTTYTARVRGGASGVKDAAGNALASDFTWSFATAPLPTQGPGGPILVVTSSANPFSTYYAEILRAEGFNAFAVADISTVTTSTLGAHTTVILG